MTLTEHLYIQFMNADTPEKKHEYLCRLMGVCLKAIGHLTPPWQGGWNRDFDSLRYRARMPWVFRWLEAELAKPQKDGARYIGRRCRNALVDEIRRHKAEQRRLAKNGPVDSVPAHRPDPKAEAMLARLQKQDALEAFQRAEIEAYEARQKAARDREWGDRV